MAKPGSEDGAVYRKVVPASRRYGIMEKRTLEKGVGSMKHLSQKLSMFIEEMGELGLNRLEMDGITKLDRGVELFESFLVKVDQALARER